MKASKIALKVKTGFNKKSVSLFYHLLENALFETRYDTKMFVKRLVDITTLPNDKIAIPVQGESLRCIPFLQFGITSEDFTLTTN